MEKKIGNYSFIIGTILALVLGLAANALGTAQSWLYSLMVVLGLIVGFLNVTGKETKEFLLVAAVLIVAAGMGQAGSTLAEVQLIGVYLNNILSYILGFVVPATIVVALKDIYALSQNA